MPLAEQAYTQYRITPPLPKRPQLTWLPRKSGNKGIRVEKVVCDVNPLIQIESKPIQATLHILLQDKTTKKNIIWATNSYESYGSYYYGENQITEELISGLNQHIIQPRVYKSAEAQAVRTQKHAEVFTPTWICNQMNNFCDEESYRRKSIESYGVGEVGWSGKKVQNRMAIASLSWVQNRMVIARLHHLFNVDLCSR